MRKLTKEETRLPKPEKIITETIDNEKVTKAIYADGSYGIYVHPEWYCDYIERHFPDGKRRIYHLDTKNIDPESHMWDRKRHDVSDIMPDGTRYDFKKDGHMSGEQLPDGTERGWYKSGQLSYESLPNGMIRRWHKNGQIGCEEYPDHKTFGWSNNGQMTYKKIPAQEVWNDEVCEWDRDGKIKRETFFDERLGKNITRYYDRKGNVIQHLTDFRDDTEDYLASQNKALLEQAINKVAERQVAKSEKMRKEAEAEGKTPERTVVKKLSPIQKSIQMAKALKEAKKSLGE